MIKYLVYDCGQNVNATTKLHTKIVTFHEWKFVFYKL